MINPLDLHALADNELDKAQAADLRDALNQDAKAQAEYSGILNLKDCIRTKSLAYSSEECWKASTLRLKELDRANHVEWFVGKYAWGLCGLFLTLIVGARYAMHGVHGDSALTSDLSRVFTVGHSPAVNPVATTQQKQWEQILNGLQFRVIDPNRLHVLGGEKGSFLGMQTYRFVLRDGLGPLLLFVMPQTVHFEDTTPVNSAGNDVSAGVMPISGVPDHVNCLIWHADGQTLVLAGPRSTDALQESASELVETVQSR